MRTFSHDGRNNQGMPEALYGVKFELGDNAVYLNGTLSSIITFKSTRPPTWGDLDAAAGLIRRVRAEAPGMLHGISASLWMMLTTGFIYSYQTPRWLPFPNLLLFFSSAPAWPVSRGWGGERNSPARERMDKTPAHHRGRDLLLPPC